MQTEIAEYSAPDFQHIFNLPIQDCGEPLQKLEAQSKIFIHAAYDAAKIPGALPDIWLRKSVITKIEHIANELPHHISLLVLDGWRPSQVQRHLYKQAYQLQQQKHPKYTTEELTYLTRHFVSLPSENAACPSPHLTGGSVDLTLCDNDGNALDMGGKFDECTTRSFTHAYETNPNSTICERRRLLYHMMLTENFSNLPSEWWHFDYGNQLWAYYHGKTAALYGIAAINAFA